MGLRTAGHLNGAELANVLAGYTLRFLLTAALSMAAAALLPGAANAAVAVLAFTIGTWALDFVAAGRGGWIQRIAAYTPAAVLRSSERGLFRVDVALVLCIVSVAALTITTIAIDLGADLRSRSLRMAVVCIVATVASIGAANIRTSFDLSENRRSSFAPAESRALAGIAEPLELTVWLSAEDPRLADLEANTLLKLRRTMRVHVAYPLEGRSALFENDDRYGTIEYSLGGRKTVNRSTTEAIVLETIFSLARVPVPPAEESSYPGYPLRSQPRGGGGVLSALAGDDVGACVARFYISPLRHRVLLKLTDAIGLRPDAHFSADPAPPACTPAAARRRAIRAASFPSTCDLHAMPFADLQVHVVRALLHEAAFAALERPEHEVVLFAVEAHGQVVAVRLEVEEDAGALIELAAHQAEAHRDLTVLEVRDVLAPRRRGNRRTPSRCR